MTFDCNRGNSSGYDYLNKQSMQFTLVKHCNYHLTYLISARYNSQIAIPLHSLTNRYLPRETSIAKEILVMIGLVIPKKRDITLKTREIWRVDEDFTITGILL